MTTFYGLYFNQHYTHICIQIRTIQLLIITEKFSPLPGFEPGTSPILSRYATNLAILAWIQINGRERSPIFASLVGVC